MSEVLITRNQVDFVSERINNVDYDLVSRNVEKIVQQGKGNFKKPTTVEAIKDHLSMSLQSLHDPPL